MQVVELVQGSEEWHAHRLQFFNASEAPIMLGISPYKTRAKFLEERRSGIIEDTPLAVQARFDEGHRVEELARAWVETEILGEDLSPLVGVQGELSASFDGITLDGTIIFEHKLLNDTLRKALPNKGENSLDALPEHYKAQMEQQLLVSGAKKCLFMASIWTQDGKRIDARYGWYTPDPKLRQRVVSGWQQMRQDLQEETVEAKAPAKAIKAPKKLATMLPAPRISLTGALSATNNLVDVEAQLDEFISRVPSTPETDDEFLACASAAKTLKDVEEALAQVLEDSLQAVEGFTDVRNKVTALGSKAREVRIACEKAVDAEKRARKADLVEQAQRKWDLHLQKLGIKIKRSGFILSVDAPNFADAIKGLSSPESAGNKLSATLLSAQAAADLVAKKVHENFKLLDEKSSMKFLFPDSYSLVYKEPGDLRKTIAERVNAYIRDVDSTNMADAIKGSNEGVAEKASKPATRSRRGKRKAASSDEEILVGLKYFKTMLYPVFLNKKHIANVFGVPVEFMSGRDAKWSIASTIKICDAIIAHVQDVRDKLANNPEWVKSIKPYPTQREAKEARDKAKAKTKAKAKAQEEEDTWEEEDEGSE